MPALILLCAVGALADDVVVLKNGREARGRILEDTDAGIKLEVGGGKLFYPRSQIAEVRRGAATDKPTPPAADVEEPKASETREEFALLYDDGRRVGTRTLRTSKVPQGFRFEEEVVFLDKKDAPEMELRTTERCDEHFNPLSFLVRENAGGENHRMVTGEVRGGRLHLAIVLNGGKTGEDSVLPADARFPFAARELFLRETKALDGKLDGQVFDTRDLRFRPTTYTEGPRKAIVADGRTVEVRVIQRKRGERGERSEREWVDDKLVGQMVELNGESLRALAVSADVVARVRGGDTEKITGPDSAGRTRYVDAERGFTIGKPDPSWTFEPPTIPGSGALLSVRNEAVFATVDVLEDVAPPPDCTVERASEGLQRVLRAVAPDVRVLSEGFAGGVGGSRYYWLEAAATTKGEKTKTLARVVLKRGKIFRLLAACPEGLFEAVKPDFVKILDAFVLQ